MSIEFDSPNAPIQGLAKLPSGEWTGIWNTDGGIQELWKYSVTVAISGEELPVLDPEIENGPPIGVDDDGEPGGGG
jgi:hypothetical protein